ncbi:microcephalin isoform X3 [Rhinatrema bivittatum]|uniref:microcephalin isoform X3 n=1 Tax=Rhinatrema bivittatum TaxID=194408 RepID=UPI001126297A|nr:microcephalin isoform X3 [Rhinatrema bivittatum]
MAVGIDSKQPILKDVVAYVEVWSSNKTENYSQAFARQLSDLGAKISKCFNKEVTHVVFKDGHQRTWNKAKRTDVKLVSVLWVEKCREAATHIDESSFPAINANDGLLVPIKRKHKCMQPKDFIEKTPENDRRLQKRLDKMVKELDVQKATVESDIPVLLFDEDASLIYSPKPKITDCYSAMEKRIKEMKNKRENLSPTASQMMAETCSTTFGSPVSICKPLFDCTTPDSSNAAFQEKISGILDSSYDDICKSFKCKQEENVTLQCMQETEKISACIVTSKDGPLPVFSNELVHLTPRKPDIETSKKQLHFQGIKIGEVLDSGKRKCIMYENEHPGQPDLSFISTANMQNKVVYATQYLDERIHSEKPTEMINDSNKFNSTDAIVPYLTNKKSFISSPVLLYQQGVKCKLQKNSMKDSLFSSLNSRTPILTSGSSDEGISPMLAILNKSAHVLSDKEEELPDFEDYFSPTNLKETKTKFTWLSLRAKLSKSPSPPLRGLGKKELSRSKRKKSPEDTVKQCHKSNKKSRNVPSSNRVPKQTINSQSELISSDISDDKYDKTLGASNCSLGSETNKQSCILNANISRFPAGCDSFNRNNFLQTIIPSDFESTCETSSPASKTLATHVENAVPAKALNGLQGRTKLNALEAREQELILTDCTELAWSTGEREKILQKRFSKNVQNTISTCGTYDLCDTFKKQRERYDESKKKVRAKKPTRSLVMTSMPSEKQDALIQVVNKFGGFLFSDSVCETTTHVVAGNPRRTLNVMLGIARGCWIVSADWVLCSLDHGRWIPEEPYELSEHFPASSICRLQRHLSAGEFRHDLFSNQLAMFISLSSEPPCHSLTELVQLCGGKVCKTVRHAKVYIGDCTGKKHPEIKYLSEKWILDSITQHRICPVENYLLTK